MASARKTAFFALAFPAFFQYNNYNTTIECVDTVEASKEEKGC